eukprot:2153210-Rhodomonas_salina.2
MTDTGGAEGGGGVGVGRTDGRTDAEGMDDGGRGGGRQGARRTRRSPQERKQRSLNALPCKHARSTPPSAQCPVSHNKAPFTKAPFLPKALFLYRAADERGVRGGAVPRALGAPRRGRPVALVQTARGQRQTWDTTTGRSGIYRPLHTHTYRGQQVERKMQNQHCTYTSGKCIGGEHQNIQGGRWARRRRGRRHTHTHHTAQQE